MMCALAATRENSSPMTGSLMSTDGPLRPCASIETCHLQSCLLADTAHVNRQLAIQCNVFKF